MDGTLVDSMMAHYHAWHGFLENHGFDVTIEELKQFIGKANDVIVPYFWDGLDDAEIQKIGDAKEIFYRENYAAQGALVPGVVEFLEEVKAAGIATAVCTSANKANMDFTLGLHSLQQYFDVMLCVEDVTHPKPNAEMYEKAASLLEVDASDCIVFEDSSSGIEAAANARMDMVLLTTSLPAETKTSHPHIMHAIDSYKSASELLTVRNK